MNDGRPLTALGRPALALSPQTGRGDTPSPAIAGEGWGEGRREYDATSVNRFHEVQ